MGANLQREETIWGAINGHNVINHLGNNLNTDFVNPTSHINGAEVVGRLEGSTRQVALLNGKSLHMADRYDSPVDLSSRHGTSKHNPGSKLNVNGKRPHDFDGDEHRLHGHHPPSYVNHNGVTDTVSVGIPDRHGR